MKRDLFCPDEFNISLIFAKHLFDRTDREMYKDSVIRDFRNGRPSNDLPASVTYQTPDDSFGLSLPCGFGPKPEFDFC